MPTPPLSRTAPATPPSPPPSSSPTTPPSPASTSPTPNSSSSAPRPRSKIPSPSPPPSPAPASSSKPADSPNLVYQSTTIPTFSGDTIISGSNSNNRPHPLVWNYAADNTSPANLSFGTGYISLDGGIFQLNVTGTPAQPISLTNNINVINNNGRLTTSGATATGNIYLAGTLVTANTSLSGTIIIAGFGNSGIASDNVATGNITISGNITDGFGPSQTPLTILPGANSILITGTNNTYSNGTVIGSQFISLNNNPLFSAQFPSVIGNRPVIVAPNSTLGTGNVTLNQGSTLQLSALSNIAPGSTISGPGTLSLTFDADPASILATNFVGNISLDVPTFTTPLNMATLGYNPPPSGLLIIFGSSFGAARLGSSSNATYAAPSLAPAPDHVYRLGISSGNLNIPNTILTDSGPTPNSADLEGVTLSAPQTYSGGTTIEPSSAPTIVNPGGTLGTGNVTINRGGSLILYSPNAYAGALSVSGTLVIDGAGQIPNTQPPLLNSGGTLVLGSQSDTDPTDFYPDSLPLNLHDANFQVFGAISENIGALSLSGNSWITIPSGATLSTPNISRAPGALLTLFDGDSHFPGGFHLNAPLPLTNNMLPAWITISGDYGAAGDFATYSANNTIIPVSYAPMPTDGGHGTEIVYAPSGATLALDTSLYALVTSGDISAPANTTLSLLSGALTIRNYNTSSTTITPNLQFGNAEAILRMPYFGTATLSGAVTAPNGLTIASDGGTWFLANTNNQIAGPINFYGVNLHLSSLGNPADSSPFTMSTNQSSQLGDTPSLNIDAPINTARPITFTATGNLNTSANATLTTSGPVTATGLLTINGNIVIQNAITVIPAFNAAGTGLSVTGSLAAENISTSSLTINLGSTVSLLGNNASRLESFQINLGALFIPTATLDIGSAAIVTQSTNGFLVSLGTNSIAGLQNLILNGPNNGITSSTVNADPTHFGIAVVFNGNFANPFTSFRGQPVDLSTAIITPALLGDTNIDGTVDLTDLATVYQNFIDSNGLNPLGSIAHLGPYEWTDGNFDYGNGIDLTDLQDVLHPFGFFPTTQSDALADAASLLNGTPTPEPTTLTLLLAPILLLRTRRPLTAAPASAAHTDQ